MNAIDPLYGVLVTSSHSNLELLILTLPFILFFIKYLKLLPQFNGLFPIPGIFHLVTFLKPGVDFFDMLLITLSLLDLLLIHLLPILLILVPLLLNLRPKLLPSFQILTLPTPKESLLILRHLDGIINILNLAYNIKKDIP